jgi:hypothetical protein
MTAVGSKQRPRRLADRLAARGIVLALDPSLPPGQLASTLADLAHRDQQLLEQAARRVRVDLIDEPRFLAARRALAAFETAIVACGVEPARSA